MDEMVAMKLGGAIIGFAVGYFVRSIVAAVAMDKQRTKWQEKEYRLNDNIGELREMLADARNHMDRVKKAIIG